MFWTIYAKSSCYSFIFSIGSHSNSASVSSSAIPVSSQVQGSSGRCGCLHAGLEARAVQLL